MIGRSESGTGARPRRGEQAFSKLAVSAGIKARRISLHSLRHCEATMALEGGSDVRTVSALLGHASPSNDAERLRHAIAEPRNGP